MEISEQLTSLFSAPVEETAESYVIEVPYREVTEGFVDRDAAYQVALLSTEKMSVNDGSPSESPNHNSPTEESEHQDPPVSEGEERIVEITEMGDQGDGLTRVERGFVVIVPETEVGERVQIHIETVHDTVAFGEVVQRYRY
ncbi:TRAM domain-containing protein [Halohasta litorea]|uniref:TRAM domain-containing protein n=1 Tax=Halohasta litorea TaxID=869891 RepID=A0ABD6DFQ8_9EURY|nr:TRAM domain-containing protein [Halohasta litorea]